MRDGTLVYRASPLFKASKLPRVAGFERFREAVLAEDKTDIAFDHAAADMINTLPQGLVRDRNWFGPGSSPKMTDCTVNHTKAISSFLVHDAVLSPASMSILKPCGPNAPAEFGSPALVDISVDNLGFWDGQISNLDENFVDATSGRHFLPDCARLPYFDCIALPVSGVGFPNYGHFLFDGLAAVAMHLRMIDDHRIRLVGPPLAPWQAEILAALDCRDRYLAIDQPARFSKLLFTSMLSFHTSYPTRFIRPLYDTLRFRFGSIDPGRSRLIYLARGDQQRRILGNRDAVEACFAEEGFDVVRPERLSVAEQVRLVASAVFVAGETGSNLANAGFSDPGTTVLELMPDCYADGWIRAMSRLLGHRWAVYFAETTRGPRGEVLFTIDIGDLRAAIRRLVDSI